MPKIRFREDGTFEFEDAEGEGEGTYGIADLSLVLIIREYDGPDDKFSFSQPVTVTAPNDQFLSLMWGERRHYESSSGEACHTISQ